MSDTVAVSADKVDVGKLKLKVFMAAAEAADIKTDGVPIEQAVDDLQLHFKTTLKAGQIAQCDECRGYSTPDAPHCPFCGIEFEAEAAEEAPPPPVKEKAPKAAKAPKPEKAAAAAAKELATAKKVEPETEVVEEAPKVSLVKSSPTALLHVDDMTIKALDEATDRILKLKRSAQHSYWHLGQEIAHVFETGLWKMRVFEKGKVKSQKYTAFEQYCTDELDITSATAYNMMKVSKAFSEAQVEKIGGTKLSIVLQAPDIEMPEIMKEVEGGAKTVDIKEKVRKAREKHGVQKKHVAGHKQMPEKAKPNDSGRVTIALVTGKSKLDMFAKPKTELKDGETMKPAKKIEDGAIAIEELSNGVTRYYALVRGPKGLRLEIETKRV